MSDVSEIATTEADGQITDDLSAETANGARGGERAGGGEASGVESLGVESLGVEDRGLEAIGGESAERVDGSNESRDDIEDEGDIAADYIEELLDICDLDGDIDIDSRGGRAYVSVNSAEDSNLRLLSNPETVQALQELTRLAVQTKTGGFSRLILDVGGSRQIREAELARLVGSAIDRIEVGGESSVVLAPMSSYERKVVHDLVAERGYGSASEGEGRDRHTVISAPSAPSA